MSTYAAVRACSIALLAGTILSRDGVTAGNGRVIDWRTVRSGETLLADADAFDTARLFVTLVGEDAATKAAEGDRDIEPAPAPARDPVRVHAFKPDQYGRRLRHFDVGKLRVRVEAIDYLDAEDAEVAALTTRLADFVAEVAS